MIIRIPSSKTEKWSKLYIWKNTNICGQNMMEMQNVLQRKNFGNIQLFSLTIFFNMIVFILNLALGKIIKVSFSFSSPICISTVYWYVHKISIFLYMCECVYLCQFFSIENNSYQNGHKSSLTQNEQQRHLCWNLGLRHWKFSLFLCFPFQRIQ